MNAELIMALRCELDCDDCAYWKDNRCDEWGMRCDAADALEAADAKIIKLNTKCADLQSQINSMENEIEELMPKEGEWIEVDKITTYCSNCNWASYSMLVQKDAFILRNNKTKFCPNCGARMKGANNEA